MKVRVVSVGRLRDAGLRALCDDYAQRCRRDLTLTELEVRDDRALLKAYERADLNVALEVRGEALSSRELAARFRQWQHQGKRVSLFIGGAEGLPSALARDCELSLSTLTLPHRLARVLLFEQIYRVTTIWHGAPYAKED